MPSASSTTTAREYLLNGAHTRHAIADDNESLQKRAPHSDFDQAEIDDHRPGTSTRCGHVQLQHRVSEQILHDAQGNVRSPLGRCREVAPPRKYTGWVTAPAGTT
jgi:hypothetical protein